MIRKWDVQANPNPWFSLGVHIDHKDPSVTLHLPFLIVSAGRCIQPGYSWSLNRALTGNQYTVEDDRRWLYVVCSECHKDVELARAKKKARISVECPHCKNRIYLRIDKEISRGIKEYAGLGCKSYLESKQ